VRARRTPRAARRASSQEEESFCPSDRCPTIIIGGLPLACTATARGIARVKKSGASAACASGLPTAARRVYCGYPRAERSVIFHDDVLNARQWFERSPGLTGGFQFRAS
jgi:hypothetical protein